MAYSEANRQSYKDYLEYGSSVIRDSSLFSSETDYPVQPKRYPEAEATRVEIKPVNPVASSPNKLQVVHEVQPIPKQENPSDASDEGSTLGPNINWIKSKFGILKALQLIFGLAALICGSIEFNETVGGYGTYWYQTETTADEPYRAFFMFVSITAFITTLVLFLIFFCRINYFRPNPNMWSIIDIIHSGVWTVFYLIASIVEIAKGNDFKTYIAAALFGFAATVCYALNTYFAAMHHRNVVMDKHRSPNRPYQESHV